MGRRVSPVRVGTRASALARVQTTEVLELLRAAHADRAFEAVPITTAGDRSQPSNLPGADWGSGVFVRDIEAALVRGDVDLAVHSLKDLPPDLPAELVVAAVLARADPRDVLVTADGRAFGELPHGARLGTSSARRRAFLCAARPDLRFVPIRGNVDTRCGKLLAGDYDAIVLAQAGLQRLQLNVPHQPIDVAILPPAPGQGAIAVQARADDTGGRRLAASLHDPVTGAAVLAERRVMRQLQGGCQLPLAALATPLPGGRLELTGAVAAPDGARVAWATARGDRDQPDALGLRVADQLRAAGADRLLASAVAS